jgi:glucose-6-phosphate isomerase
MNLLSKFDPIAGTIVGAPTEKRHLSDLRGCFADAKAYEAALANDNPLVYTVASVAPASGDGALHYGIGLIMPGRVGAEYYMTKGHLHAWRPAAEFYIGLTGEGAMLLESEQTGESSLVPLRPYQVVYVPGHTAHRTINTGNVPLTYLGVYPAQAGHDYAAIAKHNFHKVAVVVNGQPIMIDREEFLRTI